MAERNYNPLSRISRGDDDQFHLDLSESDHGWIQRVLWFVVGVIGVLLLLISLLT